MKTMMTMAAVAMLGLAMSATAMADSCCPTQKKPAATTQPTAKCSCAKDAGCKGKCETCKCEKPAAKA